jgi:hypothetical protein
MHNGSTFEATAINQGELSSLTVSDVNPSHLWVENYLQLRGSNQIDGALTIHGPTTVYPTATFTGLGTIRIADDGTLGSSGPAYVGVTVLNH